MRSNIPPPQARPIQPRGQQSPVMVGGSGITPSRRQLWVGRSRYWLPEVDAYPSHISRQRRRRVVSIINVCWNSRGSRCVRIHRTASDLLRNIHGRMLAGHHKSQEWLPMRYESAISSYGFLGGSDFTSLRKMTGLATLDPDRSSCAQERTRNS